MHAHHATTLQIRLSWTLFSIPWVALSRAGGWLADHANRRVTSFLGLVNVAFFLSLYPHIHNNVALLLLGSVESMGTSLSMPSISSLLTQGADARELGRRQGLYATANTASLAIASALLTLTTLVWWRNVRGHVRATPPHERSIA